MLALRGKTRRFQMKFRNTMLGWTVPKRAVDWRSEDCDVTCILLFVDFCRKAHTVQSGLPRRCHGPQDKPFAFRFLEGILDSTDSCEVLGEKQKNSLSR